MQKQLILLNEEQPRPRTHSPQKVTALCYLEEHLCQLVAQVFIWFQNLLPNGAVDLDLRFHDFSRCAKSTPKSVTAKEVTGCVGSGNPILFYPLPTNFHMPHLISRHPKQPLHAPSHTEDTLFCSFID